MVKVTVSLPNLIPEIANVESILRILLVLCFIDVWILLGTEFY